MNLKSHSGIVGHAIGPIFSSPAEARTFRALNCDAICTGLIPEVVTARHSKILVSTIGVVKYKIAEDKSEEISIPASVIANIETVIGNVISQ